jgi:hypothetical protein
MEQQQNNKEQGTDVYAAPPRNNETFAGLKEAGCKCVGGISGGLLRLKDEVGKRLGDLHASPLLPFGALHPEVSSAYVKAVGKTTVTLIFVLHELGLTKEDVKLKVAGDTLILENVSGAQTSTLISVALPSLRVDSSDHRAKAEFKDGIIYITLHLKVEVEKEVVIA